MPCVTERRKDGKMKRISFPEAMMRILDTLGKGDSFSITSLAEEAQINRRTVEKAIPVLEHFQKCCSDKRIEIGRVNRMRTIRLTERAGLLGLPESIQKLIIRTAYYPTPSREEEILVHAYLQEATTPEKAITLEKTEMVKKLLKQGQLLEAEKGIYLSDEGQIVVQGALKLYPELLGKK